MPDKEWPYPIQAIDNLKADYSPDHFRFAIGECRKVVAQLIAEDNSTSQQIARVKILRYLDLQLSRATRWIDEEADLLAIVLRSQIDLGLGASAGEQSCRVSRPWAGFNCRSWADTRRHFETTKDNSVPLHPFCPTLLSVAKAKGKSSSGS